MNDEDVVLHLIVRTTGDNKINTQVGYSEHFFKNLKQNEIEKRRFVKELLKNIYQHIDGAE